MFMRIRTFAFGVATAAAFFIVPVSAFSQSFEIGPGGVRIGRGGQCEELRRACENKDRLGSKAKEIAAGIGKPARGQPDAMFAANCAPLALTSIS